ncbi:MAG: pilus assembly protein PilO [Francisellaceae bacterium]|nr:pilus assembly protein PilO [Francisellaceae bacterium]
MEISGIELNELDYKKIGSWPSLIRYSILGVTAVVLLVFGIYFDTVSQLTSLDIIANKEIDLRKELTDKYNQAINLAKYKDQMDEIRKLFTIMVKQLPSEKGLDTLVKDLSQQASANNLEVTSLKPESEVSQGFFVEFPFDVVLSGNYHSFGGFVSQVSSMARIVTLHDFTIKANEMNDKDNKNKFNPKPLELQVLAKTYWYTGEEKKP